MRTTDIFDRFRNGIRNKYSNTYEQIRRINGIESVTERITEITDHNSADGSCWTSVRSSDVVKDANGHCRFTRWHIQLQKDEEMKK